MIIKYGIELETAVKVVNFDIGEYHDGIELSDYWKAEKDASLRTYKNYCCVEFVSFTFSYENREKVYNDFKNAFLDYDMRDFEINHSMGLHIHFSIQHKGKIIKYKGNIPIEINKQIKNYFFKLYEQSNLKGIEEIKKHYYRKFARPVTLMNWKRNRYLEFNTNSNKGAEWRSFNAISLQQYEKDRVTALERLNILFKIIDMGITAIHKVLTMSSDLNNREYYKHKGNIGVNVMTKEEEQKISNNIFIEIDKNSRDIGNIEIINERRQQETGEIEIIRERRQQKIILEI